MATVTGSQISGESGCDVGLAIRRSVLLAVASIAMNQNETQPTTYIRLGTVGTIVAGLVLVGFGLLMAVVIGGPAMEEGAQSEDWPTVDGVVKKSRVGDTGRPHREGENREYFPVVSYEYVVDDETYTSDRINFRLEGIRSHVRPEIEEVVDQYHPGSKVTVYYNPVEPGVSCLETGVHVGGIALIGVVCIVIGLLVVVSGVIAAIRKGISHTSDVPD